MSASERLKQRAHLADSAAGYRLLAAGPAAAGGQRGTPAGDDPAARIAQKWRKTARVRGIALALGLFMEISKPILAAAAALCLVVGASATRLLRSDAPAAAVDVTAAAPGVEASEALVT